MQREPGMQPEGVRQGGDEARGERGSGPLQRPAPGKVTRTGKLSPGSGTAVQRKAAAAAPAGTAVQRRSLWEHTTDPWMDAAHRGAAALSGSMSGAVQARGDVTAQDPAAVHDAATAGVSGGGGALPHHDRIQAAFGAAHDVSGVRAHTDGAAREASERMGAEAYATGEHIAFRGQPDLHTAAHEAAHVVQQRAGVQLSGGVGQAGDAYERHADAVADAVVAGRSAEALLGGASPGQAPAAPGPVQRQQAQPQGNAGTTAPGTTAPGADAAQVDTNPDTNPVLRLVHDFNHVPVWARGDTGETPTAHYQTPYFLNTGNNGQDVTWSGKSAVNRLTIAAGRAHAGQRVQDAIDSGRAWVGKGTPEEMHIIAQAIIDNQHDGQTPATIQAYVNDGVLRAPNRRNGKWGVDCSGFTSQLMHELEGNGRSGFTSTNAESFQHDGSRGYTAVNPQQTRMGDVISYESTNHVGVIFARWDVRLPRVGGDTSVTKPAVMMGMGESGASQDSATDRYVRDDRRFFFFPAATRVMSATNPDGPAYRLASSRSEDLPSWEPVLERVSYAGSEAWTSDYTLSSRGGTTIRVRAENGSFTMTTTVIPNGATGVELKEVESSMARVRYNGVESIDGKTTWVPARYVMRVGEGYTIPAQGQPVDRDPKLYSVVRNPNLPAEAAAGATGTTGTAGAQGAAGSTGAQGTAGSTGGQQ